MPPTGPGDVSLSRDVILDGRRRFDLRVTIAWVAGVGCSLWGYYGLEAMEIPKRVYARMLRANFDYPFVKFAMTEDDRPMLMTELPSAALDRHELGRALARLAIVADRLLEETAGGGRRPRRSARLVGTLEPQRCAPRGLWPGGRGRHAGLGASAAATPASRPDRPHPGARMRFRRGVNLIVAIGLAVALVAAPGQARPVRAAEYTLESAAAYEVRPG